MPNVPPDASFKAFPVGATILDRNAVREFRTKSKKIFNTLRKFRTILSENTLQFWIEGTTVLKQILLEQFSTDTHCENFEMKFRTEMHNENFETKDIITTLWIENILTVLNQNTFLFLGG